VRTTSSGRQQKGKLVSSGGGANLQTSHSPFTENTLGGHLPRKQSVHVSDGRLVYEQVDEMDESASGQVSLKLGENPTMSREVQLSSPINVASQSGTYNPKAVSKANIETTMLSEKLQGIAKQSDSLQTPKLSQLQEVHQTTILEENETMRGSVDFRSGSKLKQQSLSGAKKFNRVSTIDKKSNLSAAGARRGAPVANLS